VEEYVDRYLVTHEFVKRLHKRYNQEAIEIPFPIRTLQYKGKPQPPTEPDRPRMSTPRFQQITLMDSGVFWKVNPLCPPDNSIDLLRK
jgi:hypothetical protein